MRARHPRQPLRFCASVPNMRSGSATPIDWWADSSEESEPCQTPTIVQRAVVVDLREAEAAVFLGHLHPERADALEPSTTASGIFASRSISSGSTSRSGTPAASPGSARPSHRGRIQARLGMDQVEAEACPGTAPCRSSAASTPARGGLGDLASLTLGDSVAMYCSFPYFSSILRNLQRPTAGRRPATRPATCRAAPIRCRPSRPRQAARTCGSCPASWQCRRARGSTRRRSPTRSGSIVIEDDRERGAHERQPEGDAGEHVDYLEQRTARARRRG